MWKWTSWLSKCHTCTPSCCSTPQSPDWLRAHPPFQHTVCVWGVEVASRCSFGNEDDCGALRNGRLSFWLEVKHQGSISLPWSDSWRGHRGFLLLLFSNISSVEILHTPACVFASLSWYFWVCSDGKPPRSEYYTLSAFFFFSWKCSEAEERCLTWPRLRISSAWCGKIKNGRAPRLFPPSERDVRLPVRPHVVPLSTPVCNLFSGNILVNVGRPPYWLLPQRERVTQLKWDISVNFVQLKKKKVNLIVCVSERSWPFIWPSLPHRLVLHWNISKTCFMHVNYFYELVKRRERVPASDIREEKKRFVPCVRFLSCIELGGTFG